MEGVCAFASRKTYAQKYHIVGGEERRINNNNFGKDYCGDDEDGNDDDCIVFLPGEDNSNCKDNIELGSDSKGYWTTNKQQHVGV